jgi:hypothetical protein
MADATAKRSSQTLRQLYFIKQFESCLSSSRNYWFLCKVYSYFFVAKKGVDSKLSALAKPKRLFSDAVRQLE